MSLPPILPALALLGAPTADPAPAPGMLAVPALMQAAGSDGAPAELADPLTDPAEAPAPPPAAPSAEAPVTVAGTPRHAPGDPLEGFNRRMFRLHSGLDRAVIRPAAMGYKSVVPKPVRDGLRNAFSNLGEPIVFLNFLLQLKFGKAAETLARFVSNTTLGVGGLVDVARRGRRNLPHRDNGFGTTLGYYGVKPGPYLFLPLVGPTTLRDMFGGQVDGAVLPVAIGRPFNRVEFQVTKAVTTGLDARIEADAELKALFDGAVDPYATLRSVWLQNRQGQIDHLHGTRRDRGATPTLGAPLADPGGTTTGATAPELNDPLDDPAAPQP